MDNFLGWRGHEDGLLEGVRPVSSSVAHPKGPPGLREPRAPTATGGLQPIRQTPEVATTRSRLLGVRAFWVLLSRCWPNWRSALAIVQPETVIGSIRRECLDHVIVLSEARLRRILTGYFEYYHLSRPHLSLDRNSPTPREVEPPSLGRVVATAQVGGLHHRYMRAA